MIGKVSATKALAQTAPNRTSSSGNSSSGRAICENTTRVRTTITPISRNARSTVPLGSSGWRFCHARHNRLPAGRKINKPSEWPTSQSTKLPRIGWPSVNHTFTAASAAPTMGTSRPIPRLYPAIHSAISSGQCAFMMRRRIMAAATPSKTLISIISGAANQPSPKKPVSRKLASPVAAIVAGHTRVGMALSRDARTALEIHTIATPPLSRLCSTERKALMKKATAVTSAARSDAAGVMARRGRGRTAVCMTVIAATKWLILA